MGFLPAVKCVCPSCFEEIFLGECRIMSGRTTGKVLKGTSKGWRARMTVEPLDGRAYTLELACRECPHCRYLLPSNIELVPSIMMVVVGDTFSGKSHYIAALIHQIKTEWIGNATGFARFTCLTPEVEKTYTRDYFEPLFVNRVPVRPTMLPRVMDTNTKVTSRPLIYKLVVSPSPKHPPTTVNLMIYDISGEAYENMGRLVQFAQFFLNTGAFVFVADPITMIPITSKLPAGLQTILQPQILHAQAQGRRAVDGLNDVISVFEQYHGVPAGSSLPDTPVAVMLSKADLLKYLPSPNPPNPPNRYRFMVNPTYGGGVNLQDIALVDQEVRGLLKTYKQVDLLAATTRFRRVNFFATSATGQPADATGHYNTVEPCRCLDPLLWILHQLGIIKA